MLQRIDVATECVPRCPSCAGCRPDARVASLEDVLARSGPDELVLGGGDVTTWPPLSALLESNRRRERPQRLWLEAPARALTADVLASLAARGVHGVVVLIEAVGEKLIRAMGVADGEAVIEAAEAVGLATRARVAVRPKTFPMVVPLARRLEPRAVSLEILRQDFGGAPVTMPPVAVERTLLAAPNVSFAAQRGGTGYLPPCVLPEAWAARPLAFRATLAGRDRETPNRALPACADCSLKLRCEWNDPGALDDDAKLAARPLRGTTPWEGGQSKQREVPPAIARRRPEIEAICVTPWTAMEVHVSGRVHQCCSTWTQGDRGHVASASLEEIWNGEGYRFARRAMTAGASELCLPICPRLHDRKCEEKRLRIHEGSEAFVANQLLLAEEIADRREIVRSRPLSLTITPSTYCNYDCIMCLHGRTPRRDLDEAIWEQLPAFLPTLRTLTLLGGEPLANPHVMRFLREFDRERTPDVTVDLVTNGSLLSAATLKQLRHSAFGDVTISLNAGTPDVYEQVQRGVPLETVLANIDALVRYRSAQSRWFGISVSYVVQPANRHTLVEFGELALARGLRIRLLPLNPHGPDGLDFYDDADEVARMLEALDRFSAWAAKRQPSWRHEIDATRTAIAEEAAGRLRSLSSGLAQLRVPASG